MKSKVLFMTMCLSVWAAPSLQAYLIGGLNLNVDYWAGAGSSECVVAIDWNATNGPYSTAFHVFGYRWEGDKTLADALAAIDAAGAIDIVYGYGGQFINHIYYNQTLQDGDNHTSVAFTGWWWLGETQNGGQTWIDNAGAITTEHLWNGGIEGVNIDGYNWGSENMTIPEPASMAVFAIGLLWLRRRYE